MGGQTPTPTVPPGRAGKGPESGPHAGASEQQLPCPVSPHSPPAVAQRRGTWTGQLPPHPQCSAIDFSFQGEQAYGYTCLCVRCRPPSRAQTDEGQLRGRDARTADPPCWRSSWHCSQGALLEFQLQKAPPTCHPGIQGDVLTHPLVKLEVHMTQESYPSSVRPGGRSSCPTATQSSLEEESAPE